MKLLDIIENKVPAQKPRNFVAKNAMKTTSGAGKHKDKKKAAKQGEVKHKGKELAEGSFKQTPGQKQYAALHSQLQSLANSGQINTPAGKQKAEKMIDTIQQLVDTDPSCAGSTVPSKKIWLSEQGVAEGSDWGEPREILEDVLQTLERQVEWPLTEVMDPKEVRQLLAPIIKAVNDKMMSMDEAQDDWGSMSHSEFKRRELQHELGHEDDPEFQRMMREKDRGPWYIKINGKIYKQKGQPKAFDWKKGANNYALAMLKNKPELKNKTVLTRKPVDDVVETATTGSISAGNVTVGAVYPNKKGKTPKNKNGTAKNALDMDANLLTGGSIKRR